MPKPASEPMNAAGLRPTPSSSDCNASRPAIAGRSAPAKIAPTSASLRSTRRRADSPSLPFLNGQPAFEAALRQFARDVFEYDLRRG